MTPKRVFSVASIHIFIYCYAISDCSSMNTCYYHWTLSNSMTKKSNFFELLGAFIYSFDLENESEGHRCGGIYPHAYRYLSSDRCSMDV